MSSCHMKKKLTFMAVYNRDGRRAGFGPGFATRPGNPGSGLKILNSGFRTWFHMFTIWVMFDHHLDSQVIGTEV